MASFLITGGAGFVGSNLAEYLTQQGHFVRVLDNFSGGKEENLDFARGMGKDKFELIRGDIRDDIAADQACQGVDCVFHEAALHSVPKSLLDPEGYNDVNINGILVMLKAAVKHKVKRFVFASSSSVYGDTDQLPQREGQYPMLQSPYALSKLAGEYYCRIFSLHFHLETVCLRYFNIFGQRQALDDEYAVVVPKFIHCLLNNQPPPIFGDGLQSRDFTHIENVISANVLAATTPGIRCEVLNAANADPHTVLELARTINRILGKNIEPVFLPVRVGDILRSYADITRIQKALNYKPVVSFEEGLKRTVDYFRRKWGV